MTSIAERMFDGFFAESELGEKLTIEYERIGFDDYDNSLELYNVPNDERLSVEDQKAIHAAGFSKCYVNHGDKWETHYSWHGADFKASRGWRRRYVKDPNATTTNQIGADDPEHRGYYEISYWPESWTSEHSKSWLSSGYMRIVPDPMDVS